MKGEPYAVRVVATFAGVSGAVVLAVGAVLALLWVMDRSGPGEGAQDLMGAVALAAVGTLLLLVSRYASGRARGAPPADGAR